MKKFLQFVGEMKTWGCLSFTGSLCIYTLIDTFWGDGQIACATVYQLLALCGIITLLQICTYRTWMFLFLPAGFWHMRRVCQSVPLVPHGKPGCLGDVCSDFLCYLPGVLLGI